MDALSAMPSKEHEARVRDLEISASPESARLQTMRGMACILLVAFHVIGGNGSAGLHVSDDS